MSKAVRFNQASEEELAVLNWVSEGNPNCADVPVEVLSEVGAFSSNRQLEKLRIQYALLDIDEPPDFSSMT